MSVFVNVTLLYLQM